MAPAEIARPTASGRHRAVLARRRFPRRRAAPGPRPVQQPRTRQRGCCRGHPPTYPAWVRNVASIAPEDQDGDGNEGVVDAGHPCSDDAGRDGDDRLCAAPAFLLRRAIHAQPGSLLGCTVDSAACGSSSPRTRRSSGSTCARCSSEPGSRLRRGARRRGGRRAGALRARSRGARREDAAPRRDRGGAADPRGAADPDRDAHRLRPGGARLARDRGRRLRLPREAVPRAGLSGDPTARARHEELLAVRGRRSRCPTRSQRER